MRPLDAAGAHSTGAMRSAADNGSGAVVGATGRVVVAERRQTRRRRTFGFAAFGFKAARAGNGARRCGQQVAYGAGGYVVGTARDAGRGGVGRMGRRG